MTQDQEYRWKCELEIIQSLDGKIPSSREMVRLLKEKYGLTVSHVQVNNDLKLDLSTLTVKECENQKNGLLTMLDKLIEVFNNMALTDENNATRIKAANTVQRLSRTKMDIISQYMKSSMEKQDDKPIYNISIGQPKETDVKKFEKLEMKKDGENEDKI